MVRDVFTYTYCAERVAMLREAHLQGNTGETKGPTTNVSCSFPTHTFGSYTFFPLKVLLVFLSVSKIALELSLRREVFVA